MVTEKKLRDSFRFVGPVPFSEILDYYSLLDVFVVPRTSAPVCQVVTPLKPLEAMALQIPVVTSNVTDLRELVADGETGIFFKAEDPESLSSACIQLTHDASVRRKLSRASREWVRRERDWRAITLRYDSLYSFILRV
jgi:glycosyltransferase involved in cell wall biosynthesis